MRRTEIVRVCVCVLGGIPKNLVKDKTNSFAQRMEKNGDGERI